MHDQPIEPAVSLPAALTGAPPAPATPEALSGATIVLRRVRARSTEHNPDAENLDPAAPALPHVDAPPPVDLDKHVEVTHDTQPELPELAADVQAKHVVFRLYAALPDGDPRIPGLDLLARRWRAVLEGADLTAVDLNSGNERLLKSAPKPVVPPGDPQNGTPLHHFNRSHGRPAKPRRGRVTTPDGLNSGAFYSMPELAHQLRAPYAAVIAKYNRVCRDLGVDPDDHEGITFEYRGHKIEITTR